MLVTGGNSAALSLALISLSPAVAVALSAPYPSLSVVQNVLLTTAELDFGGHEAAFHATSRWDGRRLQAREGDQRAPHLSCAKYDHGRRATSLLQAFLSREAVQIASHSPEHGACFFLTASYSEASTISADPSRFGLVSIGPFPSALKLAPGLLEHDSSMNFDAIDGPARLGTRHGSSMRLDSVNGLSVELSPGTLPAHSPAAKDFIRDLMKRLMLLESADLSANNVWSDPVLADEDHLATPEGAVRAREWSNAATLLRELSTSAGVLPSDICSWDSVVGYHATNDLLLVAGLDHLLYAGRGAGGVGEESDELRVACFMTLVSFFASQPDVLRVSPKNEQRVLNAAARAIIQSGNVVDSPLTDAGLDGSNEVIQIVDTGLDETSCYFADDSGEEIQHGYYFNELYVDTSSSLLYAFPDFDGGDFTYDLSRRKIVQYINLVRADEGAFADNYFTYEGRQYTWIEASSFNEDEEVGHGTHTAGSAAGSTLTSPAETVSCPTGQVVSCVGGCIDDDLARSDDDLASASIQANRTIDIDRICPSFGCGDAGEEYCLSDDVSEVLTEHGGAARGAKLAIFDTFLQDASLAELAGTDLWTACEEAGCNIHSGSYGADLECAMSASDIAHDGYMYDNPDQLLIFAAGNFGQLIRETCTMFSPAIAKNVLAIGATSSGPTRLTTTNEIGGGLFTSSGSSDPADVDTVAAFSSRGPAQDGRIKPEVVAPGDMIYSAASDGTDTSSCRLYAFSGTSMACPITAGAAAMVRQYFTDADFYAADASARGFCDDALWCSDIPPSSATIKAVLINSANLMGGSSEPDGARGFGRVHLEMGLPLNGEGNLALFVADATDTSVVECTQEEFLFDVDADAGLDFRVTLSWIDPPATSVSVTQLIHDLDLLVKSPSGVSHTMWSSGEADTTNVNERVVVDAADVESGTWTVWVWAKRLTTDNQSFSLVVNGAISPGTGTAAEVGSSDFSCSSDNSNGALAAVAAPVGLLLFGATATTLASALMA